MSKNSKVPKMRRGSFIMMKNLMMINSLSVKRRIKDNLKGIDNKCTCDRVVEGKGLQNLRS